MLSDASSCPLPDTPHRAGQIGAIRLVPHSKCGRIARLDSWSFDAVERAATDGAVQVVGQSRSRAVRSCLSAARFFERCGASRQLAHISQADDMSCGVVQKMTAVWQRRLAGATYSRCDK